MNDITAALPALERSRCLTVRTEQKPHFAFPARGPLHQSAAEVALA